jgi:uncharacterized protein
MQIDGKRIVLTGAASGIGRALLARLASYDAEIIAADRDAEGLGDSVRVPQNIRASVNPFVCDMSSQGGTDELFAHALATMSGIDIFIANAGFAYYEQLDEADWERIAEIYRVNVFSPLYTAVKMREVNPDNPYTVVITASTMAHWALPGYALYASTKGALHRFADAYRYELPANGNLMLVYPIGTRTHFFETAGAPLAFPNQLPEAVAHAIVSGILRDKHEVYPSLLWRLGSVLNHALPVFKPLVQRLYLRQMRRSLTQQ